jgi:transposase-like protein
MDTPVIVDPASPATLTVVSPVDDRPALLESKLPDEYHAVYKLRLQGVAVAEIAKRHNIDRTTVWRWCKLIESEFIDYLEKSPTFNIVAEQFKRLRETEEENRKAAACAKSERAKALFLAGALKCVEAQNDLLLNVGVFERAPERLFKVVANVKPTARQEEAEKLDAQTREERIARIHEMIARASWV